MYYLFFAVCSSVVDSSVSFQSIQHTEWIDPVLLWGQRSHEACMSHAKISSWIDWFRSSALNIYTAVRLKIKENIGIFVNNKIILNWWTDFLNTTVYWLVLLICNPGISDSDSNVVSRYTGSRITQILCWTLSITWGAFDKKYISELGSAFLL